MPAMLYVVVKCGVEFRRFRFSRSSLFSCQRGGNCLLVEARPGDLWYCCFGWLCPFLVFAVFLKKADVNLFWNFFCRNVA